MQMMSEEEKQVGAVMCRLRGHHHWLGGVVCRDCGTEGIMSIGMSEDEAELIGTVGECTIQLLSREKLKQP